jgi:fatty-acyl-CoA synthase
VMDEDGYFRITGRLKEMIIRGGENIYPAEIEAYYYENPKVLNVAVFGVPDEKMGEEICAWIQLRDGQQATPEELQAYIKQGMSHFKVPRHVQIVDEFPMTVTGKMQKFRMSEVMSKELEKASTRT